MALEDIQPVVEPPHKGGGILGSIAGAIVGGLAGVAGVVAAPFTGGASLGLIPAGMSAGQAIGGLAGNAIDPAKGSQQSQMIPQQQSSQGIQPTLPLNSMQDHPELQLAHLQDAKQALQQEGSLPGPQVNQYMDMFNQAQTQLKNQLGVQNG